ncbi:hypothetical protein CDAR_515741 [Caerostris darwini]|uniref:Uncharacterized protein n=1 Tax=Caerostris darwini TaxID=1538125 RepID=A0AAV4S4H9_9ARAC|nr:hypothetical protein CDAR_515741 [Caerostris darwini]
MIRYSHPRKENDNLIVGRILPTSVSSHASLSRPINPRNGFVSITRCLLFGGPAASFFRIPSLALGAHPRGHFSERTGSRNPFSLSLAKVARRRGVAPGEADGLSRHSCHTRRSRSQNGR